MTAIELHKVNLYHCRGGVQGGRGSPFGEHQMAKTDKYVWEFKARFRRHAYGWKSPPAIQRVKQAAKEIRKVARKGPVLAVDGAVTLLERLSPVLENVDSSSGAIRTAVNNAVAELEAAPAWADRLLDITRMALSPDKNFHSHFHGTSACLSALFRAERYGEIVDILQVDTIWAYQRWAVKALAAMGRKGGAIRMPSPAAGRGRLTGKSTRSARRFSFRQGPSKRSRELDARSAAGLYEAPLSFRGIINGRIR